MRNFVPPYLSHRTSHLGLLLVLFLLVACRSDGDHRPGTEPQPHFLVIDTFRIPVLASPDDQLAYGRATFEEQEEKAAALRALRVMHPAARLHAAKAELELAYLRLGTDYRLADDRQCTQAMENYLAILNDYADFPEIAAKALWYLGWISCDLRGIKQGLEYFHAIVDKYPREMVSFLPPAPWLTIRPTDTGKEHQPYYAKSTLSWAAIAHLEIIRHSTDHGEAWQSFTAIAEKHGNDGFTGLAMKTLIATHGFEGRTAARVKKYLADNLADPALRNDLHFALADYLRESPQEAERP